MMKCSFKAHTVTMRWRTSIQSHFFYRSFIWTFCTGYN